MRLTLLLVTTSWLLACGEGAEPAPQPVDYVGGDPSAERLLEVREMMEGAIEEGRISAAIALLARDADVLWQATAGEMAPGVPMRDDAILPLASVGKTFTAVAALILSERGVISLEDPVSRFIPEFADAVVEVTEESGRTRRVPAERPINVLHLLTHTGGLTVTGDSFWEVWDEHTGNTTTTHFARDLVAMPLFAQPGEAFRYGQTGASYEVLGAVIEQASGQTLEAFMQENIFDPLGLEDTYFYLPAEKGERMPTIYRRVEGELLVDRPMGADFSRSTFFHGGGGVRSSADDVHRFARLFLNGGAVDGLRILSPETIESMMRDRLGELAPDGWKERRMSWGMGAAVRLDESGAVEQYGWAGGGFARLWVNPAERLIAYFNVPLTPPGDFDLLLEFERRVYAAFGKDVA